MDEKSSKPKNKFRFGFMHRRDFPLVILAAGVLLTVGIWDYTNRVRSDEILENTRRQADQVRLDLTDYFSDQFTSLVRSSAMLAHRSSPPSEPFKEYWKSVLLEYPGMMGVQLIVSETDEPAWSQSSQNISEENLNQILGNISHSKQWNQFTHRAGRDKITVSSPFAMTVDSHPTMVMAAILPLPDSGALKAPAYLIEYFDVQKTLDEFFKTQSLNYYNYLISHQWQVLHTNLKFWRPPEEVRAFKVTRQVDVADKNWFFNIWPKESYLADQIEYEISGILILVMGILFSISAALFAWSLVSRGETLEKIVKIRTEQIEHANHELTAKNEEIENFLYVVSHDLKAPLVSMKGFISILKAAPERNRLGEEECHAIDRIDANVRRMHNMLLDLLELSRVGRVEEGVGDIETSRVVRDIVDEMKPLLDQRHIRVEIKGDLPVVRASRARLEQVFSNLIGNAVKYMGSQTAPEIVVGTRSLDAKEHQFFIRDNGPGIPVEFQDKIFQVFQRGPNQTQTEGTGIGLSIVRKIIEHYGGRVWLESRPAQGSIFYFTLPGGAYGRDTGAFKN
ncbi:MAG: HAMP domain-containing histidine kinase [Candidatus Omnitrophica bacterium]|nr:HAMP domain-containing histidine kinase [Candidatus Omnitrophota bacterium]